MAEKTLREKQKKQLMLAALLLSVLALLILFNVKRAASKKAANPQTGPPISSTEGPLPGESPPPGPDEVALETLKGQAGQLAWGRDPFLLDIRTGEGLPTLQLRVSGIIFDPVKPESTYAIINEEVVRIGDNIRGIQVIDIQPDSVRLKKFNQEFTLYLYEEPK